jgi:hypothetical protein
LAAGFDFDPSEDLAATHIGVGQSTDQRENADVLATPRQIVVPARIVSGDQLQPETGFNALDDLMRATLLERLKETTNQVLGERSARRQGKTAPRCELFEIDAVIRDFGRTALLQLGIRRHAWVRVRRGAAAHLLYFGWLAIPKDALAQALAKMTCPDSGLGNDIVERVSGVIIGADPETDH